MRRLLQLSLLKALFHHLFQPLQALRRGSLGCRGGGARASATGEEAVEEVEGELPPCADLVAAFNSTFSNDNM